MNNVSRGETLKMNREEESAEIFLAQLAKFLVDHFWHDVEWEIYLKMFGFGWVLDEVPRLTRSQYWGDSDYPSNVLAALEKAYHSDPEKAVNMIMAILNDVLSKFEKRNILYGGKLVDINSILSRYPAVKHFLESKKISGALPSVVFAIPPGVGVRFLDITEYPDDFYRELVELINRSYLAGIYPAVFLFARKLIENLIIDILRKRYGLRNVELFFDSRHRRFKSLNELIKNFRDKLKDFQIIIPSLDQDFINKLNKFRERGNATAHALEILVKREDIDELRDDLRYVVMTLIRLLKNIPT